MIVNFYGVSFVVPFFAQLLAPQMWRNSVVIELFMLYSCFKSWILRKWSAQLHKSTLLTIICSVSYSIRIRLAIQVVGNALWVSLFNCEKIFEVFFCFKTKLLLQNGPKLLQNVCS